MSAASPGVNTSDGTTVDAPTPVNRGANPVVIIAVILITILIIILIIMVTRAVISTAHDTADGSGNTTNLPPCADVINSSKLLVIPDSQAPCQADSIITLYYLGNLSQGHIDFVAAPITTSYINVCAGFCATFTAGVCTGPDYAGNTAQQNYDQCLATLNHLTPSGPDGTITCVAPAPVAIKDNVLFYPYSPTCRSCDSCA